MEEEDDDGMNFGWVAKLHEKSCVKCPSLDRPNTILRRRNWVWNQIFWEYGNESWNRVEDVIKFMKLFDICLGRRNLSTGQEPQGLSMLILLINLRIVASILSKCKLKRNKPFPHQINNFKNVKESIKVDICDLLDLDLLEVG